MSGMLPEVEPSEVGLDPIRLGFIAKHFDRYVQDRKLPGFLSVVTRGGKVAHVARGGIARPRERCPSRDRYALSHLLDDQASDFRGAHELLRAGPFGAR